jgi:hypothetical protein
MMPIFVAQRVPLLPLLLEYSAPWKFLAMKFQII